MYKICEKCGYMYADNGEGCPNCHAESPAQPENPITYNEDLPVNDASETQPENSIVYNDISSMSDENAPEQVNSIDYEDISSTSDGNAPEQENAPVEKDPFDLSNYNNSNADEEASPISLDGAKKVLDEKVLPVVEKNKKLIIIVSTVVIALTLLIAIISGIVKGVPVELSADSNISDEIFTDGEIREYYDNQYSDEYDDDYGYEYNDDYDSGSRSTFGNEPYGSGLIIHGYNGTGFIAEDELYNIFDWNEIIEDADKDLKKKKKINKHFTPSFHNLYSLNDSLEIHLIGDSAEKNGKLKNGDVVEIEYTITQYKYTDEIKCKPCTGTVSFTIEGLTEVEIIDPFKYVEFVQSGVNGEGIAKILVKEDLNEDVLGSSGLKAVYQSEQTVAFTDNGDTVATVSFYLDDSDYKNGSFSNEDTINVSCSVSDGFSLYSVVVDPVVKEYTFDALGSYISTSSEISKDDLDAFIAYADDYINDRYEDNDDYLNIKLDSVYIAEPGVDAVYPSFKNNLCLVYSYSYLDWFSSESETRYMYISFKNVIADKSGVIETTPEDSASYINSNYVSVDDILVNVYGGSYKTVKIK